MFYFMKDFAKSFYLSDAWRDCRDAYYNSVFGVCERCGKPGAIVHHIIELTPENIGNPNIALSFDNLRLVCRSCHRREHSRGRRSYRFDAEGNLI